MTDNPVTGAAALLRGFRFLVAPGLRRYVVIPVLLNALLFAAFVAAAAFGFDRAIDWMEGRIPEWLGWIDWLLWPLFVLGMLLSVLYLFTFAAALVAAPFYGPFAEAIERRLEGRPAEEGGLRQILADVPRAIGGEISKLAMLGLLALQVVVLMFIPVANLAAPFLWMLYGAWGMALEYADFPMGNHRLFFRDQWRLLRRRPLVALGFGGAVSLGMLLPVLNLLVMPAAVAGATLLWVEVYEPLAPRSDATS